DENGRFTFDRLIFSDSTKFVVQTQDEKGKQSGYIRMDEIPQLPVGNNKNAPEVVVDISQSMAGYLKSSERQFTELQKYGMLDQGIMLDEVTITARKPPVRLIERSANLNGPGNADQILTTKDLQSCPSLEVCLQGRLTGVI